MVDRYIKTRPILDLCERSARRPGAWVSRRWWEHNGLEQEGTKERATEELDGDEAQSEGEGLEQEERTGRK